MIATHSLADNGKQQPVKVWVLAPALESPDENISYYYDFTQSIEEYKRVFSAMDLPWQWTPVNMKNYRDVINEISKEKHQGFIIPVVLNLCDGDEINGTPGISVVKLLEEKDLVYTGADEFFYNITTSKLPMKQAFDHYGVPSAAWEMIDGPEADASGILKKLGTPVIVKPAVSGGSMGVSVKNVVETEEELSALISNMYNGYRGWNLTSDGIIAEKFIPGREFTIFISGSCDDPSNANVYPPVERVFHPSLPDKEKFLSFDRLWEIYEDESPMPDDDNFYEYSLPEEPLIEPLKKISWDAYCAINGKGYTRVDVRMDQQNGRLYVLEVNAQCGISEDENFTSIGAILRLSGKSFTQLVREIIQDALHRNQKKKQSYIHDGKHARA